METLQSTIFIEFDVNTKKITFLRGDNIIDYDSNITKIYVRVKYKNLSGNTVYLTPSELEGYKFTLYTIKPATNDVNEITGEVTDELKENVYGGVVKFEIPRACTNRLGIVKCEIHINQGNKIIGSSTFVLDVKQSLVTAFDDEILNDEDFPVLKQLILEVQKVNNIDDNYISKTTTYSSNKIETIKKDFNFQLKEKATKKEVDVERKRIDRFVTLPEGSTTGDAELIDIRVGADAINYPNAGDAVRDQIGNLNDKIDTNIKFASVIGNRGFEPIYPIPNSYEILERRLKGDGEGFSTHDENYKILTYNIEQYECIYIKSNFVYQFQKSNSVRNEEIPDDVKNARTVVGYPVTGDIDAVVCIPEDATCLMISVDINDNDDHVFVVKSVWDREKAEITQSKDTQNSDFVGIQIDECSTYPIKLEHGTTDEYSCPIAGGNATCSLKYYDFLEKFFDCYIGFPFDGYKVKKRVIGRDSSNKYDIYEYDFCPRYYNRTVLLSAGMNSNELPGEFGIAYFIKNVMEHKEAGYAYLYKNVRFKIIPILCPWSFDQSPLKYDNYNDVSLNQNFDFRNCWDNISGAGSDRKGNYPCDQAETQVILKWLNENAYKAELWIDCHTSAFGITGTSYLYYTITSDDSTNLIVSNTQTRITQAYIDAGYFEAGTDKTGNATGVAPANRYPKHLYSYHNCGIPSIMIEQYTGNPLYGGVNETNNSKADIDNYVTMLRAYILAILKRETVMYSPKDLYWMLYQFYTELHSKHINYNSEIYGFECGSINNKGLDTKRTNRCRSKYIEVTGGDEIYITVDSEYRLVELHEYDSSHTWLSRTMQSANSNYIKVTVSENTAYVRYIVKRVDEADIIPSIVKDKVLFLINNIEDSEKFTHQTINLTGNLSYKLNRAISPAIELKNNKVVVITGVTDYTLIDVALYDSSNQFLRINGSDVHQEISDDSIVLCITDEAAMYVRFSLKRKDEATVVLSEVDAFKIISY